jgi:predicted nucleotidyltransferase
VRIKKLELFSSKMPTILENLPTDITLAEALALTEQARKERKHQTQLEAMRRYNAKHHEEMLEKKRLYRESHRAELAQKNREYRAKKKLQAGVKSSGGTFPQEKNVGEG